MDNKPLLIDRVVSYISPRSGLRRIADRKAMAVMNSYEGASKSRRTEGWRTTGASANDETQNS